MNVIYEDTVAKVYSKFKTKQNKTFPPKNSDKGFQINFPIKERELPFIIKTCRPN